MFTSILIIITGYLTATLSGLFGMGGGVLLMGILGSFYSVGIAMILHGFIQAISNGSRAFFLRRSIKWNIIPFYGCGVLVAVVIGGFFFWVPRKSTIFLVMGFFPFISLLFNKGNLSLNMMKKGHSFFCGILVMTTQLLAGASGPILDIFYNKSALNRQEVVATKAFTQAFGHIIKLFFYIKAINIIEFKENFPMDIVPFMLLVTLIGTYTGKKLLIKVTDIQFKKWGQRLVLSVGMLFLYRGFFS
jgi:uncharacterized membrane protein YfcA